MVAPHPTNLDIDLLRSLVIGVDLGGYGRAAVRLGRSPSAVSLRLRRLEEQVGRPLFLKQGRGLALTETGETLLGYARRILDLNDAALAAMRDAPIAGEVRIGLPQDVAETRFPDVLARFARLHPNVRVQARVDRNAAVRAAFEAGDLDLGLLWSRDPADGASLLSEVPMTWVGSRGGPAPDLEDPVPLVLLEAPCAFRTAALDALDRASRPWRVTFSTPSLSGLWAAVAAGLGVTVRTAYGLPPTLAPVDAAAGLPALPRLNLTLLSPPTPEDGAIARLAAALRDTFSAAPATDRLLRADDLMPLPMRRK